MSDKESNSDETSKPGLFQKGGPGGPGRPKGLTNFTSTMRRKAEENGVDLDELGWTILLTVGALASAGDMKAAALFFDRVYGPLPKTDGVAVQINNGDKIVTQEVPRLPQGKELSQWGAKFIQLAEEQGVIEHVKRIQVVRREEDEAEELLS